MLDKLKGLIIKGTNAVSGGAQQTVFSAKAVLVAIKNKITSTPPGYTKPEMKWNESNELVVDEEPKKKKKGRPSKKDSNKEVIESKPVESTKKEEPKK